MAFSDLLLRRDAFLGPLLGLKFPLTGMGSDHFQVSVQTFIYKDSLLAQDSCRIKMDHKCQSQNLIELKHLPLCNFQTGNNYFLYIVQY